MPEELGEGDALEEISRLRAKQAAVDDEDIRLALQARIDSLESSLKAQPQEKPKPTEERLPEATPEQLTQADQLIRQARVEKMRQNSAKALALMKEAAEIAPSSPTVLEALGDDLLERRQYKDAEMTYRRAFDLDPRNVSIETKLANVSLKSANLGSYEQMLRMGDATFLSSSDNVASLGAARMWNALMPGVGHIAIGRTAAGIAILVVWLVCIGWIAWLHQDVNDLAHVIAGKQGPKTLTVLLPIFGALVTWIGTQASLGTGARESARKSVEHPRPPVDLPF